VRAGSEAPSHAPHGGHPMASSELFYLGPGEVPSIANEPIALASSVPCELPNMIKSATTRAHALESCAAIVNR